VIAIAVLFIGVIRAERKEGHAILRAVGSPKTCTPLQVIIILPSSLATRYPPRHSPIAYSVHLYRIPELGIRQNAKLAKAYRAAISQSKQCAIFKHSGTHLGHATSPDCHIGCSLSRHGHSFANARSPSLTLRSINHRIQRDFTVFSSVCV
jgi:hypothetical protein